MYINFKEKTGNYICAVNARESAGYLNGVWAVTRLINGKPHSRLSIHLGGFVEFHFDFLNEDGSVKTLNALETSMKNGTREYYDNNSEKEFETPKTEFIIDKNCLFFNDFASMIVCFNGLMFRSAEGRKRILRVSALRNKERIMKAVSFNFSYEGKNNIIVDRVMVPILAEPQKASCPITKNEMMGICAQKKIMYSLKNMY
ncbi:MAG: hypothetical protein PHV79_01215, partial [Clostridia bacterium]|nr:hypothetical protein [Clostridia bacterium]